MRQIYPQYLNSTRLSRVRAQLFAWQRSSHAPFVLPDAVVPSVDSLDSLSRGLGATKSIAQQHIFPNLGNMCPHLERDNAW